MGDIYMNFFSICDEIAEMVNDAVAPLVGTPDGGRVVGMGADQTPTKLIDKVAEDCIIEELKKAGICDLIISEEAGKVRVNGEPGTIFLDPIDGTYNAVSNIPFFALSIALATNRMVRYGYVRNLKTGEVFTAERGCGAFQNGKPISVSLVQDLGTSAMSIYGKHFEQDRIFHLMQKIRRFRQFGASALELSYVAAGKIDGFVDLRNTLRVTDAAAGVVICQEAGGRVTDMQGNPIHLPEEVSAGTCLVATNNGIHQKVIEYLR